MLNDCQYMELKQKGEWELKDIPKDILDKASHLPTGTGCKLAAGELKLLLEAKRSGGRGGAGSREPPMPGKHRTPRDESGNKEPGRGHTSAAKVLAARAAEKAKQQDDKEHKHHRKKKKKKKKTRRRKRSRSRKQGRHRGGKSSGSGSSSSSSSSSSSTTGSDSVFRGASSLQDGNAIRELARSKPGRLLQIACKEMTRYLQARGGGSEVPSHGLQPIITVYFLTVMMNTPEMSKLSVGRQRELRTLSESLDCLIRGDTAAASDILIQRFKAIEMSLRDRSWKVAERIELIPDSGVGLSTTKEREVATHEARRAMKLEKDLEHRRMPG